MWLFGFVGCVGGLVVDVVVVFGVAVVVGGLGGVRVGLCFFFGMSFFGCLAVLVFWFYTFSC